MSYEKINPIQQLNFQINRVLTYGDAACRAEDVRKALSGIKTLSEWYEAWMELARQAEAENRYLHAGYAFRMTEFFLKETHPQKKELYQKAITNFYQGFDQLKISYEIHEIPYKGTALHSVVVGNRLNGKTILVCGGYDSFLEEFILAVIDLVKQGYAVLFFEGDGQGKTLQNGLPFTHAWEEPTACVLDYYQIDRCPMIGISWGGYLAMRAAAFEKRICAVVSYDVADNGYESMTNIFPPILRKLICRAYAKKKENRVNQLVRFAAKKSLLADWAFTQGQLITHTDSPFAFYREIEKHNLRDVYPNIKQDCLLLAGEKDHYIPAVQFERMKANLINANSVKAHLFTQQEGGEQHCQIGCHQLAMEEILSWLRDMENKGRI